MLKRYATYECTVLPVRDNFTADANGGIVPCGFFRVFFVINGIYDAGATVICRHQVGWFVEAREILLKFTTYQFFFEDFSYFTLLFFVFILGFSFIIYKC